MEFAQIFDISIDELVDSIPKGITELRGKKVYLKLGIFFTVFYLIATLILLMIFEPLHEYVSTTYDTFVYFFVGFVIKPLTVISGGIGISFLIKYGSGFYIKNKILSWILIVSGIICFLFSTVYLFYVPFVYRFGLSFIVSPYYYVFLLENPFLHVIGPIMMFFGIAEK